MGIQLAALTDRQLITHVNTGNTEAFEELIKRHESKAYNLAFRLTRNHEDAEEVLQDVFISIYRKLGSFEGKSAFSSWMYRIVVNAAFMKLRKRKQSPTISMEELTPAAKHQYIEECIGSSSRSDTWSMNRELRHTLEDAITRLPDEYRAVYVLRDVDGLSNQEAAEILELSIPAIKSRLHRARLMLRKKLQRHWEEYTGSRYEPATALGAN